jgi:hypothetical protein
MKFFDDDALDRALASVPLETPPSDLHARILAATVFAAPPILTIWEIVAGAGVALSLAWLAVSMRAELAAALATAFSSAAAMAWLTWLGIGAAIAATLVFTQSQASYAFARRAKPSTKP